MNKIISQRNMPYHYCCQGIRILRGDFYDVYKVFGPIYFSPPRGYGLTCTTIYFCPCCGYSFYKEEDKFYKSDNNDFCCSSMESRANKEDPSANENQVYYQPFIRRFYMSTNPWTDNNNLEANPQWDIYYCLFCGHKLAENLTYKWLEILKTEFNIPLVEPIGKMLTLVPENFKTDKWWKERDL